MAYFTKAELEQEIEKYADTVYTLVQYLTGAGQAEAYEITEDVFSLFAVQDTYRMGHEVQRKSWLLWTTYDCCREEKRDDVLLRMIQYLRGEEQYSVKSIAAFLTIEADTVAELLEKNERTAITKQTVDTALKRRLLQAGVKALKRVKNASPVSAQRRRISYLAGTAACIGMVMFGAFLMRILPENTQNEATADSSTLVEQEKEQLKEANTVTNGTITLFNLYHAPHHVTSDANLMVLQETENGRLLVKDTYHISGEGQVAYPFLCQNGEQQSDLTITADTKELKPVYCVLGSRIEGTGFEEETKYLQQLFIESELTEEAETDIRLFDTLKELEQWKNSQEELSGKEIFCAAIFSVEDGQEIQIKRDFAMPKQDAGVSFVLENGVANNITDETCVAIHLPSAQNIRCIGTDAQFENVEPAESNTNVNIFNLTEGSYLFMYR